LILLLLLLLPFWLITYWLATIAIIIDIDYAAIITPLLIHLIGYWHLHILHCITPLITLMPPLYAIIEPFWDYIDYAITHTPFSFITLLISHWYWLLIFHWLLRYIFIFIFIAVLLILPLGIIIGHIRFI
jgi:hypothetical protein